MTATATKTDTDSPTRSAVLTESTTFEKALRAVFPHASRDKYLPILTGVNMTGDKLVATDRYTMGIARFATDVLPDALAGRDVWISPALCRLILGRKGDPVTHFNEDDGRTRVEFASGFVYDVPSMGSLDVEGMPTYPDLIRHVDGWTPVMASELVFNSEFSSRFAATHFGGHTNAGAALVYEPGKSAAARSKHNQFRVTRSGNDWFVGIVVEMRTAR